MKYPFDFIQLDPFPKKPRTNGITSLLDKGLDYENMQRKLELCGEYIDIVKFGFGTARLIAHDKLLAKIGMLKAAGVLVCPGGTFFEIAYKKNMLNQFFAECQKLGFNAIEISDGIIEISLNERINIVKRAQAAGFTVFVEIGRKIGNDANFFSNVGIKEISAFIELGVEKIILEARESGTVGLFNENGDINLANFESINKLNYLNRIIFEAPLKKQQAWLINQLGAHVNLGNIAPEDVLALTCLRFGLRADTIKYENSL